MENIEVKNAKDILINLYLYLKIRKQEDVIRYYLNKYYRLII
jgi:hypothetical protein